MSILRRDRSIVLSTLISSSAGAGEESANRVQLYTGNGEWTYTVADNWGKLPAGTTFGGTHGGIASDKGGNIYVSTQSGTGVLVYANDGKLLRTIANDHPAIHSLVYAEENSEEYFYCTVQQGTPEQNWLFIKMTTDGTVVQKIVAPPEAGFRAPNEWRITAALPGPDGSIYVANGYGDSRIFKFDKHGNYQSSFAGKGREDGKCDCCHGLALDTRYEQPFLLVCDRENLRLSHYDLDGNFVRNLTFYLRRPCQVSFYGEYAAVSELQGRVTILDKNNVPVSFLGDNPQREQWAKYDLDPDAIAPTVFTAAHGCYFDRAGNVYVSDWNRSGRVSKLVKLAA
jgi:hypothetical protein